MLVVSVLACIVAYVTHGRGTVMSLDDATISAFQEAQSKAATGLHERQPGLSPPVEASMALRRAISKVGYNPDKTLLYWCSPEFRSEVAAGNPAEIAAKLRFTENLLAVAFGDAAGDADFDAITQSFPADLRAVARNRRGFK